jgi:hypothetical protein
MTSNEQSQRPTMQRLMSDSAPYKPVPLKGSGHGWHLRCGSTAMLTGQRQRSAQAHPSILDGGLCLIESADQLSYHRFGRA